MSNKPLGALMHKNKAIVIELSKTKLFVLLVIAVTFVALGLWAINLDSSMIETHKKYNSPFYVHIVGAASLLMGILAAFISLKKIFERAPGLVISDRGIIENSNIFSVGEILWKDVSGFQIVIVKKQKILYVLLKDPELYICRCSPLKRALLRFSLKVSPSPIAISTNSLKVDFEEMNSMLKVEFEKYRRST